jgi:transposase
LRIKFTILIHSTRSKMQAQGRQLDFTGQKIFIGLDVHRKSWNITIRTEHIAQKTFSMSPPDPRELVAYLERNYPNGEYHCAYEAGFCGFWPAEALTALGVKVTVAHPADVPTTDKDRQQKTDPRDSRKLARGLSGGELEGIYVPGKVQQESRSLARERWKLAAYRRGVMNRIKSHLHFRGHYPPQGVLVDWAWDKSFLAWLVAKGQSDEALRLMLAELSSARAVEQEVMRSLRMHFRGENHAGDMKLLMGVPGIGFLTAVLIITELGDIKRFKTFDRLCFYVGLVPRTNNSGEKEEAGRRTTRGNKRLRTALIESAWVAIRSDPELALAYGGYKKRMDGVHAIIKVARKLLNRVRYVLKSGKPYTLAVAGDGHAATGPAPQKPGGQKTKKDQ